MSSKIVIQSYDSFFRKGLQMVTDSICLNGISCTGNILLVDLLSVTTGNYLPEKDFCHVIYIISEPATVPFLSEVEFKHDVYFLIRDSTVECFLQTITRLVVSIMQAKCYWVGIRKMEINDAHFFSNLTKNETKFLAFYKNGMSIKNIAYSMRKAIKTVYSYRSSIMFKLKIKSKAQLARVMAQADLIKEMQAVTIKKNKPAQVDLKRQECRNISSSLAGGTLQ